MKKVLIILVAALLAAATCILLAVHFLSPGKEPTPTETTNPSAGVSGTLDGETPSLPPENANPIKIYSNGIATFVYDSRKVYFDEMPSDNIDGAPQTWFFMADTNTATPSVAAFPLALESPFGTSVTDEDWEELAKAYIMSFFSPDMQRLVTVKTDGTVVKIDGDTAKMYVRFDCDVASSPENNINGVVRLVSNANNAMVTVAITADGQNLPEALTDVYMSVSLS